MDLGLSRVEVLQLGKQALLVFSSRLGQAFLQQHTKASKAVNAQTVAAAWREAPSPSHMRPVTYSLLLLSSLLLLDFEILAHHADQGLGALGVDDERVFEELLGSCTLRRVLDQATRDKVVKLLGPLVGLHECRRWLVILRNDEECLSKQVVCVISTKQTEREREKSHVLASEAYQRRAASYRHIR